MQQLPIQFEELETIESQIYGECLLLRDPKTDIFYISKDKLFNSRKRAYIIKGQIEDRLSNLNSYYINPSSYELVKPSQYCPGLYTISIIYPFVEEDLKSQIKEASKLKQQLSETVLTTLLYESLIGMSHLEELGIEHTNISPSTLARTRNGYAIIDDPLLDMNRVIDKDDLKSYYLSPECYTTLKLGKAIGVDYSNLKSDVFSLGLVILEATILKHVRAIFTEYDLDKKLLAKMMKLLYKRFPKGTIIGESLTAMLQLNPKMRPSFFDILSQLPKYKNIDYINKKQLRGQDEDKQQIEESFQMSQDEISCIKFKELPQSRQHNSLQKARLKASKSVDIIYEDSKESKTTNDVKKNSQESDLSKKKSSQFKEGSAKKSELKKTICQGVQVDRGNTDKKISEKFKNYKSPVKRTNPYIKSTQQIKQKDIKKESPTNNLLDHDIDQIKYSSIQNEINNLHKTSQKKAEFSIKNSNLSSRYESRRLIRFDPVDYDTNNPILKRAEQPLEFDNILDFTAFSARSNHLNSTIEPQYSRNPYLESSSKKITRQLREIEESKILNEMAEIGIQTHDTIKEVLIYRQLPRAAQANKRCSPHMKNVPEPVHTVRIDNQIKKRLEYESPIKHVPMTPKSKLRSNPHKFRPSTVMRQLSSTQNIGLRSPRLVPGTLIKDDKRQESSLPQRTICRTFEDQKFKERYYNNIYHHLQSCDELPIYANTKYVPVYNQIGPNHSNDNSYITRISSKNITDKENLTPNEENLKNQWLTQRKDAKDVVYQRISSTIPIVSRDNKINSDNRLYIKQKYINDTEGIIAYEPDYLKIPEKERINKPIEIKRQDHYSKVLKDPKMEESVAHQYYYPLVSTSDDHQVSIENRQYEEQQQQYQQKNNLPLTKNVPHAPLTMPKNRNIEHMNHPLQKPQLGSIQMSSRTQNRIEESPPTDLRQLKQGDLYTKEKSSYKSIPFSSFRNRDLRFSKFDGSTLQKRQGSPVENENKFPSFINNHLN